MIAPGAKIYAKKTVLNESYSIRSGDRGWVTHVTTEPGPSKVRISFYLERRALLGNPVEAVCDGGQFGANFVTASEWKIAGLSWENLADQAGGLEQNPAYIRRQHYVKQYPDLFLR